MAGGPAAVLDAPADACPVCFPGDHDAVAPLASEPANGGVIAAYQCPVCSAAWETWWCRDGWPAARQIAPVTPEQAARNFAVLAAAVQPRGKRAA